MKFRFLLAAAIACVSFATQARQNNVIVSLAATDRTTTADQEVMVDLTFTNTGSETVRLLKWFVPDGDLEDSVFMVMRDGKPVQYVGPHYKRGVPTLQDTVTLEPGATLTRSVDIAGYYDFSASGVYTIQYGAVGAEFVAAQDRRFRPDLAKGLAMMAEDGSLASNETAMWIDGRANALPEHSFASIAKAGSIGYSGRCSSSQQSTLVSAVNAARTMASNSLTYLNGTPGSKPRYTTWFGTYSSSSWSTVRSHYTNIVDALNNQPLVLDCSCNKSYYAYVYPTQPYKVYLCRAFWSAPLTGTDSKGGTLVHELSHFNVVAGTDDWAYGQSAAKQLALSDPAKARDNADSHEYFAENTPAQN